ncbi:hypothetical protein JCM11641_004842 [Rhodosporidiobolus odoratus]
MSSSPIQRMTLDCAPLPPSGAFARIAVGAGIREDEPLLTLEQRYRQRQVAEEAASDSAAEAAADAAAEAEVQAIINEVDPHLDSNDEGEEVGSQDGLRNGAPAGAVGQAVPAVPIKGKPRQKKEDGEETERERRAREFEAKLQGAVRIPDDKKRRARYDNVGHAINRLIRLADVETGGFFAFWTAFLVHLGKYDQLNGTEATAIDTCQDFYDNFEAMTTTARDKHAGARVARKAAADLRKAEAERIRLEKEWNTEKNRSAQLEKESAQEKAKLEAVLASLTPEARALALAAAEAASASTGVRCS